MKKLKNTAITILFALLMSVTGLLIACGGDDGAAVIPEPGPEAGVYYYDDETLALTGLGEFSLVVGSTSKTGRYTVSGSELAFKYADEADGTMVGTAEENAITVTYNGAVKRFYRKTYYTVKFDAAGGSAVADMSVLNGGKLSVPQDPTYSDKVFIGWYTDEAHTKPYMFKSDIITGDKTLYAYWVDSVFDVEEYVVDFDLGYAGAEEVPSQSTIGGKLYKFPEVYNPDGSALAGWWVSDLDSGDADKLTYKYDSSIVLKENTTLHAVWTKPTEGGKLAMPNVSVLGNEISWNAVSGATGYVVSVTDPDGKTVTRDVPGTSTTADMSAAGEYTVTVKARAAIDINDSETTTRSKVVASVARVSLFTVMGGNTLVYNAVEGAQKYIVSVKCGNPYHDHDNVDNGTSTYYNFANCDMREGGIQFTVKAVAADGTYSVSRTYPYEVKLKGVYGFSYDEAAQRVSWRQVMGATEYYVSVNGGDYVSIGNVNYISIKEYSATDGVVSVKVYPATKGCLSPEAAEYIAEKTMPATPTDIVLDGKVLSWEAIDGASYIVAIGDREIAVNDGTTLDMSGEDYIWEPDTDYVITVSAVVGGVKSAASDGLTVRYGAMSGELKYDRGTLRWNAALGADGYEISVNDGAPVTVDKTATSYKVKLGKAGVNTITVKAKIGDTYTEALTTEVYAYAISLDSRGGSEIDRYEYRAIGDTTDLPVPTKVGHSFEGWYNAPGGADSNAGKYSDKYFNDAGEKVLYAYYTPNTYKAIYNYFGGNGTVLSTDVTYNKEYSLVVPVNEQTGGVFGGWWSNPNGIGIQYTDEDGKCLEAWTDAGDKTLYAYWIEGVMKFNLLGDGKSYSVEQGEKISSVTKVRVPTMYNGLPVTTIEAAAFSACSKLTEIDIPETVTLISSVNPFEGCKALTDVNVYKVDGTRNPRYWSKDGVIFDNGTGDQSSVMSILFVPAGKTGSYAIPQGIQTVSSGVFTGTSISEIVIPESVERIESNAFDGCLNLSSVVFESGSANALGLAIAAKAFSDCPMLEEITLPARLSVIDITRNTYDTNGNLSGADMKDAFIGCTSLKNIYVADGCRNYSSRDGLLLNGAGTTILYAPIKWTPPQANAPATQAEGDEEEVDLYADAYVIPTGITEIGDGAFLGTYYVNKRGNGYSTSDTWILMYNTAITKLVVPNYVRKIGDGAFYGSALTAVKFQGDGLVDVVIGKNAFRSCDDITALDFEPGCKVATIGDGAFRGCSKIPSLTIPANTGKIGANAFAFCSNLAAIEFAEDGVDIAFGENAFSDCTSLSEVTLPSTVKNLSLGVFSGCKKLTSVVIDESNPNYVSVDGVVYDKKMTTALFFPMGKSATGYKLPSTVTTIGNGFFANNTTTGSFVIGKNVEYIGSRAFYASKFTSIEFEAGGESKLVIGEGAFYGAGITSIVLPDRTSKLEKDAFRGYSPTYLTSITLNEGLEEIGDGALQLQKYTSLVIPSTVKTLGKDAFYGNTASGTVSITFAPNSQLTTIGDGALHGISGLVQIKLPASVKSLGKSVFSGCGKLERIDFEDGAQISVISTGFYSATSASNAKLSYVKIPAAVEEIQPMAFNGAQSLTDVDFEPGGTKDLVIGSTIYTRTSGATISASVIDTPAFKSCSKLTTITLPARTKAIGVYAFNCDKLDKVYFEENCRLEKIYPFAFRGMNNPNISYIQLENCPNLKTIGEFAFEGAKNLTSIKIPTSVQDQGADYGIGYRAFYGCGVAATKTKPATGLATVEFMPGARTGSLTIGEWAFCNCYALQSLTLPSNFTRLAGNKVFINCTNLKSFGVSEDNKNFVTIDDVLYKLNDQGIPETLVKCPAGKVGKVTVPNTVRTVESEAFHYCYDVTEIEFAPGAPDDAKIVFGDYVFGDCTKLTSIVLPSGATRLGAYAFQNCAALKSVTISKSMSGTGLDIKTVFDKCTAIEEVLVEDGSANYMSDDGVLYDGTGLSLLFYPLGKPGTEYNVKEDTTAILANAFKDSQNLVTVNLPSSLTTLYCTSYNGSFQNCKKLKNINFAKDCKIETLPGGAFNNCSALQSLRIPASVTKIIPYSALSSPYNIFNGNSGLQEIIFEEGSKITEIPQLGAFQKLSSLKRIVLPKSLEVLGNMAFKDDKNLEEVVFPDGCALEMLNGTFSGCVKLTSIRIPAAVKIIKSEPFKGCTGLTKITFESGSKLETIGEKAFCIGSLATGTTSTESSVKKDGLLGITELEIPSTVTTIGNYAFAGCYDIKKLVIPEGVTKIGDYAFADCLALSDLRLPAGITSIGKYAFILCVNIKAMPAGPELVSIGEGAFLRTGLTTLDLSDYSKLTTIDKMAFRSNENLTKVVLPDQMTVLGNSLFNGCTKLSSVHLPDSLTAIGDELFDGCTALTKIEIPDSVETIGTKSTAYCFRKTGITEFTIPANVKIIQGIFTDCTHLTTVKLHAGVTEIVGSAFSGCTALKSVYVPSGEEGEVAPNGAILPNSIKKIGTSAFKGTALESITLPNDITKLESSIFENCTLLTSVTIPSKVTEIGSNAFKGSGLSEITIPTSVTKIGSNAFQNCTAMTEFVIPNSVIEIGSSALSGMENLQSLTIPFIGNKKTPSATQKYPFGYIFGTTKPTVNSTNYQQISQYYITNVTTGAKSAAQKYYIPKALKSVTVTGGEIVFDAFINCNMIETVDLSRNGVANAIGVEAFKGCSALTSIKLSGVTVAIGNNAFENCTALTEIDLQYVTSVGDNAFKGCTGLENVYMYGKPATPETPETPDPDEGDTPATPEAQADEPAPALTIGASAFENCTSLTSFDLSRVTEIGDKAFKGCTDITTVTVPATVTKIGASVLEGWTAAQTVTMSVRLSELPAGYDQNALAGCNATVTWLPEPTPDPDPEPEPTPDPGTEEPDPGTEGGETA